MSQAQFSHGGHVYRLKVERQNGAAILHVQRDGAESLGAKAEVEFHEPWLIVRQDGETHRVLAVRDGEGVWVALNGRTWYLKHERSAGSQAATTDQDAQVRAPMTGTVIKVLAEPGARVAPGDLLAVMEAMKMEYRLEARSAGQVERVHCRPGDLLHVGAVLVELAPEKAG